MNRWRKTLAKRRKKQRGAQPGDVPIFKGTTAAVTGVWKPGTKMPEPPPLEVQGLPTVVSVLEDCEAVEPPPDFDGILEELLAE